MTIPENIIEEKVIEETTIYTYVELEGESFTNVKMTKSEMERLMSGYDDGSLSKEYVLEVLFNVLFFFRKIRTDSNRGTTQLTL